MPTGHQFTTHVRIKHNSTGPAGIHMECVKWHISLITAATCHLALLLTALRARATKSREISKPRDFMLTFWIALKFWRAVPRFARMFIRWDEIKLRLTEAGPNEYISMGGGCDLAASHFNSTHIYCRCRCSHIGATCNSCWRKPSRCSVGTVCHLPRSSR